MFVNVPDGPMRATNAVWPSLTVGDFAAMGTPIFRGVERIAGVAGLAQSTSSVRP